VTNIFNSRVLACSGVVLVGCEGCCSFTGHSEGWVWITTCSAEDWPLVGKMCGNAQEIWGVIRSGDGGLDWMLYVAVHKPHCDELGRCKATAVVIAQHALVLLLGV
jgi:hypothetical protein